MKTKALDPVEVYTPNEAARMAGVDAEWLLNVIRTNRLSVARSSWLSLISSDQLPEIERLHREWKESKRKQRQANKRFYNKTRDRK